MDKKYYPHFSDDDSDLLVMTMVKTMMKVEKEYGSRLALESPHPGRLKSAQVTMKMTMTITMTMR